MYVCMYVYIKPQFDSFPLVFFLLPYFHSYGCFNQFKNSIFSPVEYISHIHLNFLLLLPPLICDQFFIILLYLCQVYIPHMRENMWLLAFWTWLTSLKLMLFSSIHLSTNDKISFFYVAEWNSIEYKYIFLNPFLSSGHFGYFHSIAIVNSSAINRGVQVLLL
jgi:hypothetical protein